jgi:hypothetical protein
MWTYSHRNGITDLPQIGEDGIRARIRIVIPIRHGPGRDMGSLHPPGNPPIPVLLHRILAYGRLLPHWNESLLSGLFCRIFQAFLLNLIEQLRFFQ